MTPTQMDRQTFLSHLRVSGLVGTEQLQAVQDRLPETHRGRVVARALVQMGLLTKFQAEMLLAGRTTGFHLGQYRILDQVGLGGMGRVFKAVHLTMDRVVAVKVLAPHLMKTDRAQQLFRREVRAAARLVHPNIATAYDANQVGDRHYLVMEYVDGPNLEQWVRREGPLPVGLACDLIRQAALGLQCAADLGMVHRDIKPANILVQGGSNPRHTPRVAKIVDFGLALLQDSPTETGPDSSFARKKAVVGTPDFISPEQARSLDPIDIRSDLYSLGCTFYFLLAGEVPFPGGNTLEKLIRHSTEEPMPLELLRPEVPVPVLRIVRRLMARDPEARYRTPADLAEALAPFAVQSPTSWGNATPAQTLPGPQLTPPGSLASGLDLLTPAPLSNPDSALAGTLRMDFSPTPMSAAELPSVRSRRAAARDQHRNLLIALTLAAGIVAGLAALVMLLLLL